MLIYKPWGSENIIEKNDRYVLKELFMKKGCSCSLQYHKYKHETIYVVCGTLKITLENQEKIYNPNDTISISPGKIHRMQAIENCIYLEASTPELDDIIRLEDNYGRI